MLFISLASMMLRLTIILAILRCSATTEIELDISIVEGTCTYQEYAFVSRATTGSFSYGETLCGTTMVYIGNMTGLDPVEQKPVYDLSNEYVKAESVPNGTFHQIRTINAYLCWNMSVDDTVLPVQAFKWYSLGSIRLKSICFIHYYTKRSLGCATSFPYYWCKSNPDKTCFDGNIKIPLYEYVQIQFNFTEAIGSGYLVTHEIEDISFTNEPKCEIVFVDRLADRNRTNVWQLREPHFIAMMLRQNLISEISDKWTYDCDTFNVCTYFKSQFTEAFILDQYPTKTSIPMWLKDDDGRAENQSAVGIYFKTPDENTFTSARMIPDPNNNGTILVSFKYAVSRNVTFQICIIDETIPEVVECTERFGGMPTLEEDMHKGQLETYIDLSWFNLLLKVDPPSEGGILLLTDFYTSGFYKKPKRAPRPPSPHCEGSLESATQQAWEADNDLRECMIDPVVCDFDHGFPTWSFNPASEQCEQTVSCVNRRLHDAFISRRACEDNCVDRYFAFKEKMRQCGWM